MAITVHTVDVNDLGYQWSGADQIKTENDIATAHVSGKRNTFVVRCKLPVDVQGAGVAASVYLGNWQHIDYVAIGYTQKLGFRHIKVKNIRQNAWVELAFTHQDIIWQLQNGDSATADAKIGDIKIFIKGEPGQAEVKVRNLRVLQASQTINPTFSPINKAVVDVLTMHFRRALRDYQFTATEFLQTGQCPMLGKKILPWSLAAPKPEALATVNSFCSSWHGMHLPIALMLYAEDSNKPAPLIAARVWVEQWLDNSYFQPDSDPKYTWYDHGTAERLLALILLWHKCAEQGQDARFANRLWHAIAAHAELLNSEAFYAYHQPTRYHNHAWFQDAALIALSLAFPQHENASNWLNNGISRFEDQLEHLIVRDGGYAIFVENSIGYHHGVQKLAEVVGALVKLSGLETEIPSVAQELTAWSEFLRYPDGRVPAQGDTFRLPPRSGSDIRRGKPWASPGCTVLPKAGYAIVKGNHDNKPWMLCLFNTSTSSTHKHEDNLSITFWFDGVEWLIDPSFYSHEYDQEMPKFLRGAAAHNTISFLKTEGYFDNIYSDLGISRWPGDVEAFSIYGRFYSAGEFSAERGMGISLDVINIDFLDVVSCANLIKKPAIGFVFGEGVSISMGEAGAFTAVHPDSSYVLSVEFKSIQPKFSLGKVCAGVGFMECTSVEKITVSGFLKDRVEWTLKAKKEV